MSQEEPQVSDEQPTEQGGQTPCAPRGSDNRFSWVILLIGLGLIALTVRQQIVIAEAEGTGGTVSLWLPVSYVYQMLGRWGVLAVFGTISAAVMLVGIAIVVETFRKTRKDAPPHRRRPSDPTWSRAPWPPDPPGDSE